MRRLAAALGCALIAILTPCSFARSYAPPAGRIYTGVSGGLRMSDYQAFAGLSGHRPAIWQLFLTFDQDRGERPYEYLKSRFGNAAALGVRLMLHISTVKRDGHEYASPAQIAAGRGDRYLIRVGDTIAQSQQVVYIRPYAEMNNFNSVYAPGHGAGHQPWAYRRMFQRTVLIMRGGSVRTIDRTLRALGMPGLKTGRVLLRRGHVAIVWCPQVAPQPWSFWPGSRYVDWIATDFFSGHQNWSGLEGFYRSAERTRKPFAIAEFAIHDSGDDPGFVSRLMRWARTHTRTHMTLYFQGNSPSASPWLSHWPASRRALRSAWNYHQFLGA